MRVCLFEDDRVSQFEPLTWTRPVFDLLCGTSSLATKQIAAVRATSIGALVRPHLVDVVNSRYSSWEVPPENISSREPLVLVNGRWIPPSEPINLDGPCVGLTHGEVAYLVLPEGVNELSREQLPERLSEWLRSVVSRDAGGHLAEHLWDLVAWNADQIREDFEQTLHSWPGREAEIPTVFGDRSRLLQARSARIEPMVVADTTNGPVIIDRDVEISAFSRLEGPCYIGRGTHVSRATIRGGTTIGPNCRIGGELEDSIVQGYTNKHHEGFLGHSYLGEWINLGAGTQTSDLRNDYGSVRVILSGFPTETGQTKVGSFIGDHTKTGLGVLLNTGSNIGIFCNVLPSGGYCPKYVPPLMDWWKGNLVEHLDLEGLLGTARQVMARRDVELTPAYEELYRHLFENTRDQRRFELERRVGPLEIRAA